MSLGEACTKCHWYPCVCTISSARPMTIPDYGPAEPEPQGRKGTKTARPSQIPPDVLLELATHYGLGLEKYPDDEEGQPNWQRGYDWRLSADALGRHLLLWLSGEDTDEETGSSHLIAVAWHCFTLRWFHLHGKGKDFR